MPLFTRYVGVDYSGAATPERSLPGLSVYAATLSEGPVEVLPRPSSRKYFTRRDLAEWLLSELRDGPPTLVGMDHGFSFPLRYFEAHELPLNWGAFLEDFYQHWPSDMNGVSVEMIREGKVGCGAKRLGNARWRRRAEERCGAKSVFHFDVQGSVAKSTHAGLPWLLYLRRELGNRVHMWPFDGWCPPRGVSVMAEVYPALWSRGFQREKRNGHQQDAYSIARWMQERDAVGELGVEFQPSLGTAERSVARVEGWILGVR